MKQAKKRVRQATKAHKHNASLRSMFRTCLKKVLYAIDAKDHKAAEAAYKQAVPVIDKMVSKGLIHKNKAARHKHRLNGHIHAMA